MMVVVLVDLLERDLQAAVLMSYGALNQMEMVEVQTMCK